MERKIHTKLINYLFLIAGAGEDGSVHSEPPPAYSEIPPASAPVSGQALTPPCQLYYVDFLPRLIAMGNDQNPPKYDEYRYEFLINLLNNSLS